ncbi:MAG TPA: TetR/AcrR family transcriptional regulator [Azospirillum sp.]|nr:TetR/AcrR family transcriptional regulator [Azospirillum sp.]
MQTIFEATVQILDTEGEKRLTTNRVAERAGFSIGTLYQYFPSMESVLLAMIDLERRRVIGRLDALLAEAEASQAHPRDYLRLFIRISVEAFGVGDRGRRLLLKRGWKLDHTEPVIAATRETAERIRVALERRNHPDFPPPSPAALFVVSRAVLGAIRAAVLEDSDLPGTPEFEDALVRLAEGMLAGREAPQR